MIYVQLSPWQPIQYFFSVNTFIKHRFLAHLPPVEDDYSFTIVIFFSGFPARRKVHETKGLLDRN